MNPFQIVALSALGLLALRELFQLRRGAAAFKQWLLRTAVLAAALAAIARPELTNRFAHAIGIGRGADVVLYLFVLAFLFTSFAFYSRSVKLERQVTALVGKLAQLEAQRGAEAAQERPRG